MPISMPLTLGSFTIEGRKVQIVRRAARKIFWITVDGRTAAMVHTHDRFLLPQPGWSIRDDVADWLLEQTMRAHSHFVAYCFAKGVHP
ncbi:hypothetical protein [Salininema proteolyticum]|uniref:Uncharacterized protein n=1 Tax=Salininema proteolyticum TaxID=1607685 RepID=A0ABV8TU83_9ACTN